MNRNDERLSRRDVLARLAGLTAGIALARDARAAAEEPRRLFKIGACDWSLGRTGDLRSLEVAREAGLDGVQVSFGRPGAHKDLRSAEVRSEYRKAAKAAGQEIASLAMGVLNGVPLATEAEAERWVGECIEVCPEMGVKVVLLAFFDKGDILDRPDLQPRLVERLKRLAPGAEKARVVLGLETYLSADDHIRILDAVGSPAVQVYYDVANMTTKGYDIHKEIRRLGRERICEFHMKENGFLLGKGKVDFARVKAAIDEIGYRGWLIIEGATVAGRSVVDCYRENQKYLRSVFPTSRKKESA